MRKVRDYDQELSALAERASRLKAAKIQRLGELVIATGADQVGVEALAGALLFITLETKGGTNQEAWRSAGAAFFQHGGRKAPETARGDQQGISPGPANHT
jgi:Conjugal transfer protein TraD